ncbi:MULTISPECIES: hypothetical protein [Leeuwenhoekiella]|uniref:Uncharacterized protein n=1 Tax=Leeuwenhoekiella palythoae TaxID=573501 RepID=A0A1M5SS93_9FLAO|nr:MULTISPECIES: hypothetical protein [Leeuwenhoekiella]MEC7782558.1 hypothetical protein [Bacteroidota bacterium]HAX15477.1 hypothetical protein [Leeuwenhoekiella sp.]MEC8684102.1 hypothetical protein [Bacteroidota bacterium]MEE3148844.1 hypothetical protein [Bacteroidota bacterium]MEE3226493.1 hypothetical protein [Bacteroidota bacterium]|tara:strand:+ start:552 stop:1205 length:654 start_codon:yes stop_codon:yes gene_type:complete
MKIVIQLVLWVVIGVLGYLLFNAVYGEVKFNDLKVVRYQKAVNKLKEIQKSQMAYKQITGKFAEDFDQLIAFIDTAEFVLTERRDTLVLDEEATRRYRVDTNKEITIIDTLGFRSVKDSLFQGTDRYKTMMNVPAPVADAKFEMEAGTILKSDVPIPVFEAKVSKDILLADQPKDYVAKEKQVVSVEGVNGAYLTVGSMTEVKTAGNWPKSYGDAED